MEESVELLSILPQYKVDEYGGCFKCKNIFREKNYFILFLQYFKSKSYKLGGIIDFMVL
jgi:hypothetical protein